MPANIGVKSCEPALGLPQDRDMVRRRNNLRHYWPNVLELHARNSPTPNQSGKKSCHSLHGCIGWQQPLLDTLWRRPPSGLDSAERHCPLLDFPGLKSSSFTNTTLFIHSKQPQHKVSGCCSHSETCRQTYSNTTVDESVFLPSHFPTFPSLLFPSYNTLLVLQVSKQRFRLEVRPFLFVARILSPKIGLISSNLVIS